MRQLEPALVGFTQASKVIFWVTSSEALSATVTMSSTPSNDSEPPNLPFGAQVAPEMEPLLPLPEASRSVVPLPASNEYSATAGLTACAHAAVDADMPDAVERLPFASYASTDSV